MYQDHTTLSKGKRNGSIAVFVPDEVETERRYLPRLDERLHLIRHETNRGVGGAIASGYKWCRDHEMDVEVETEKR